MRERYRRIRDMIIICMCIIAMVLLNGCAKTAGEGKNNEEKNGEGLPQIIVGSDNYPPFNYINTDGEVTGIDVELAGEAFRRIGYQAVFRTINWEEKKNLLANGEIDCIWGCFSMDGREDDYKWAGPYMISRQVVAVKPDSDIETLQELSDKKVAVQSTTKPEEIFCDYADYGIPELGELISVEDRELIYSFLSKGYVDAIAAHETAILQYMSDYDMEYRILDEPLQTVGLGVAFDKRDERGLAEKLSQTFKQMREDGTEERIIGEYLDQPAKYMEIDAYEE